MQALIENELAGKAIQPQVLVSVTKPISQTVTVTGEAVAGARLPLTGHGDRLLDVIATAGRRALAGLRDLRAAVARARTATVPLTTVVSNPKENIYLRPNDVLTLVRDPQTFLAVGALGNSTELPFSADGITLAQALAKARGLSDFQADPAGTFIFRFEPAAIVRRLSPGSKLTGTPLVPVVYRIDMRDPNSLFTAQAFRMRNRDLIYVSNAPFTEIQKVLGVFSTVTAPSPRPRPCTPTRSRPTATKKGADLTVRAPFCPVGRLSAWREAARSASRPCRWQPSPRRRH